MFGSCVSSRFAACLVVALGFAPRPAIAAPAAAKQPHLVAFLSDDHSLLDCTVYGATHVRTPNMQQLANDGLTFTHAFVASPSCAPSRAALTTGLWPVHSGAEANHTNAPMDMKTLPKYLQELGYEVAVFGKVCHYGDAPGRGYDHVDERYGPKVVRAYLKSRDNSRPLCLLVGTHSPHVPWPDKHSYDNAAVPIDSTLVDTPATREFRNRYYEDVTTADRQLGETRSLAREYLGDDILFLYTSDHGAQWPFGKWNLYDAGIRTPMIAAWPGVIEPGDTTDAMVSWLDILPTFIELAGGEIPAQFDGRSFAPVLRGQTDEHYDRIFTTHTGDGDWNVYPIRSVRTRGWKYIRNLHPEFAHTTHIDQAAGKDGLRYWREWIAAAQTDPAARELVDRYHRRPAEELYDLQADPREEHNLAADPAHAERLAELSAELDAWLQKNGDEGLVAGKPRPLDEPAAWAPGRGVGKRRPAATQ
ncbi:MAG: sulfatase [Planctomycetales bacterium]|nr:sulfatase [Planctomycetales bacterium]